MVKKIAIGLIAFVLLLGACTQQDTMTYEEARGSGEAVK